MLKVDKEQSTIDVIPGLTRDPINLANLRGLLIRQSEKKRDDIELTEGIS